LTPVEDLKSNILNLNITSSLVSIQRTPDLLKIAEEIAGDQKVFCERFSIWGKSSGLIVRRIAAVLRLPHPEAERFKR
jgi:hypothetical protein